MPGERRATNILQDRDPFLEKARALASFCIKIIRSFLSAYSNTPNGSFPVPLSRHVRCDCGGKETVQSVEETMRSRGRALHKKCIAGAHRAPLQSRTPSCGGGLWSCEKIAFTTCQMSNVCCAMFNVVVKTPDDLLTKPPNPQWETI